MFHNLSGEATEQRILDRLRSQGCIINESVMMQIPNGGGWIYGIHLRRPRWLSSIFGHGPEKHLSITAKATRALVYNMHCMRTDSKGSLKQWTCRGLESMLASI